MIGSLLKSGVIIIWSVVTLYFVSLLTLSLMGYQQTVVVSNSMAPLLEAGDVVLLKRKATYEVGDIIQFERSGLFFLHRIVKKTEKGFETQGDANPVADLATVTPSQVHGQALGVLKKLGAPLERVRSVLMQSHSNAGFTASKTIGSQAHSRFWLNPTMSWTIITGVNDITFSSPNGVTFLSSGVRTIQSSITSNGLVRIYMEGRQTNRDANNGGFQITTHACQSLLSKPTCGWLIQFDDTNRKVNLRTYQTNGGMSPILTSVSYSSTLNVNRKYVFEVFLVLLSKFNRFFF